MRYYNGWKSLHALTAPRARSPICHPELTGCVAAPSPSSLSPPQTTRILPPPPRRESIPILGIEGIREGGREGGKASSLRPVLSSLSPSRPRLPSNINGACGTRRGMHRRIKNSKTRKVSLSSNRRKWGGKANYYVLDVPKHPPPPSALQSLLHCIGTLGNLCPSKME